MIRRSTISGLAVMLATAGCAPQPPPIGTPPAGLAPFYVKSLDAGGIPISGSANVPDAALVRAWRIVEGMLGKRPDLRAALVAKGQRGVVMAPNEGTVDLPEQSDWKKPTRDDPRLTVCERKHYDERIGRLSDRDYWNRRARGMGGLLTSGAAENLLGTPNTRYYGENILVHEFSHAILGIVMTVDPALYQEVVRAYDASRRKGLWRGEYGDTSVQEYWAEGTQFWFESNKLAVIGGRRILSAKEFARYDPALAQALEQVYGRRHHLRGDAYWRHAARVPPGPPPVSTAEVC